MDYSQEYFTIENLGVGTNTLTIVKENIPYFNDGTSNGVDYHAGDPTGDADAAPTITIYYSFDKTTWTVLGQTSTTALTVDFTDKIYLKANCNQWAGQLDVTKIWSSTDIIRCSGLHCISGNIMSIIHGDDFISNTTMPASFTFVGLFYNNTTLTNINNLILSTEQLSIGCYMMMFAYCSGLVNIPKTLFSNVTSIANNCFRLMFRNCTSLLTVHKKLLPFSNVPKNCYMEMFRDCTSMTVAPNLPATILGNGCYYGMFRSCTNLIDPPEALLTTVLPDKCYMYMFHECTSLTTPPNMAPTTIGLQSCYSMFNTCSSLVHPPKMYPTTVGEKGCAFMFNFCSSLLEPINLPALNIGPRAYYCMFQQCTNLQYFPALPATELSDWCYAWMFQECSSASNTISLPATVMKEECYHQMFCKCTSLQVAPELPATTLAKNCYFSMFNSDTSLIQAPKLKAIVVPEGAYHYMFYGCMNLNYIECQALDISATGTTLNWLHTVMPVGTFVQHANMNSWTRGNSGIPTGWNVLFVDESGTTFSSEVKTQHTFENAIVKDFKDLTVNQAHVTSSEFKEFVEVVITR